MIGTADPRHDSPLYVRSKLMCAVISVRDRPGLLGLFATTSVVLFAVTSALADDQDKGRPNAPGDHVEFRTDSAGSYLVTKPLKDKYDNLVKRVGELKAYIGQARIDESQTPPQIPPLPTKLTK